MLWLNLLKIALVTSSDNFFRAWIEKVEIAWRGIKIISNGNIEIVTNLTFLISLECSIYQFIFIAAQFY